MVWKLVLYENRGEADKAFFDLEIPYIKRTQTHLHPIEGKPNPDDQKNPYEYNKFELRLYPDELVDEMSGFSFTVLEPKKVWMYASDRGRQRFMDLEKIIDIWAPTKAP